MRGRGLKLCNIPLWTMPCRVAPHAGAWIETAPVNYRVCLTPVAPHAGAWIETLPLARTIATLTSPLMRGRGLKQSSMRLPPALLHVAPHAGAWIETYIDGAPSMYHVSSPLMRGRGLKLLRAHAWINNLSRPSCGGVD